MKIAIYARVSTQGGKQDTENQLIPLREWAVRLGGEIVVEFVDEASGSKGDRLGLKQLLDAAHRGEYDTVLIWALDRLSREGISKMTAYLDQLKSSGIKVLSHQESWLNTSGPIADLLIAIFGWVAQQERSRIQERIHAGLRKAKLNGRKLGRPSRSINNAKAFDLKAQGMTVRAISQHLGVPRSTLSRILSQKPSQNLM